MFNESTIKALNIDGRIPCHLFFNRVNGVFLHASSAIEGITPDGGEYMVFVEADYDLMNDKVVGNYPDFVIMNREEGPQEYYEAQADHAMSTKITKVYPVVEQVNILGRAIQTIATASGIPVEEFSELTEMLEYIKLCKDISRNTKEFYRDSPDFVYISNERAAEINSEQFEGGLHEHIGARPVEGGRVFG